MLMRGRLTCSSTVEALMARNMSARAAASEPAPPPLPPLLAPPRPEPLKRPPKKPRRSSVRYPIDTLSNKSSAFFDLWDSQKFVSVSKGKSHAGSSWLAKPCKWLLCSS